MKLILTLILCALVTGVQAEGPTVSVGMVKASDPWMQLNPGQGGQILTEVKPGVWGWTTTPTSMTMTMTTTGPQWTLYITDDGQLEINGKAVEKMSDPEIKVIMQEIAAGLRKQSRDSSLVQLYDRQTEYLLDQLERCRKEKK